MVDFQVDSEAFSGQSTQRIDSYRFVNPSLGQKCEAFLSSKLIEDFVMQEHPFTYIKLDDFLARSKLACITLKTRQSLIDADNLFQRHVSRI